MMRFIIQTGVTGVCLHRIRLKMRASIQSNPVFRLRKMRPTQKSAAHPVENGILYFFQIVKERR
jgi:hypothetical protein